MTTTHYFIRPHSPLVFRSGRPFGAADDKGGEDQASFPLPSSVAGALRAAWVDGAGHFVSAQDQTLLRLHVQGPLLARRSTPHGTDGLRPANWQVYVPRPLDAIYQAPGNKGQCVLAQATPAPMPEGCGSNLPADLQPVMSKARGKPQPGPAHWSLDAMAQWLGNELNELHPAQYGPHLPQAVRSHVVIDSGSLTGVDQGIFQTVGLDFGSQPSEVGLLAGLHSATSMQKVGKSLPHLVPLDTSAASGRMGRLGADGRAAQFEALTDELPDTACPEWLQEKLDALKMGDSFRLVLITPACYLRNGWVPDGLRPGNANGPASPFEGCLVPLLHPERPTHAQGQANPHPQDWRLRLRAATLGRWMPLAASSTRNDEGDLQFTRRALRRLVPAGAIYWFEILQKGSQPLSSLWMASTCRTDYARDGFGLSLPGLA